jgi:hypothetical protein
MVDYAPPARSKSSDVLIEAAPEVPSKFFKKREVKRPLEDVLLFSGDIGCSSRRKNEHNGEFRARRLFGYAMGAANMVEFAARRADAMLASEERAGHLSNRRATFHTGSYVSYCFADRQKHHRRGGLVFVPFFVLRGH